MDSFSSEHLLLSILGGAAPAEAPAASVDPGSFVALCRRHRVASLVHHRLANGGGVWPPRIIEPLKETTRRTLVDNLLLLKALHDTAGTLTEEGIGFVLLKGASLLGFLYPEIQMRPMTDIDLLIREKDWPKVAETLEPRGYRLPSGEAEQFYRDQWYHQVVETPGSPPCYVEFHWNLESVERSRIDPDELIRDAVPCEIEGQPFLRLCDDHLLVHLSLHLAHHFQDPSLHWVEDIRRLLGRASLRWDRVAKTAREWGVENCLAYSFGYLERLYPGTLPEPARRFTFSPARKAILSAFRTSDPILPHRALNGKRLRHAVSMVLLDRWLDVARYVVIHSAMRVARLSRGRISREEEYGKEGKKA